ncbi:MAG TPA: TetR/AcrR family transcriptional regulator [Gemmatimonadaceae bacterium]
MTRSGSQEPRWRRAPEERPAQIIGAALEVFGEVGLARARLEDIARRAGVSKGTIYVYFPDKDELFKEVVRSTVIRPIERAERDHAEGTPADQLTGFMREHWRFLRSREYGALHRMVLGELRNFPELAEFYTVEAIARGLQVLTDIIQRGIDAGDFRAMDARAAARGLTAMFISHAVWCADRACFPHLADKSDDEVFAELSDLFFHAIRARGDAPVA